MNQNQLTDIALAIKNYLKANYSDKEIKDIVKNLTYLLGIQEKEAQIYSSVPLNAKNCQKIEKFIQKIEPQVKKVKYLEDRSLLAGIKIKIGDDIYDYSLDNKLKQLEQKMGEN